MISSSVWRPLAEGLNSDMSSSYKKWFTILPPTLIFFVIKTIVIIRHRCFKSLACEGTTKTQIKYVLPSGIGWETRVAQRIIQR